MEILAEGEAVNELCLVVQGAVEALTPEASTVLATMNEEMEDDEADAEEGRLQRGNRRGNSRSKGMWSQQRVIKEGATFGESAFFTELPQLEVGHDRLL